ncbi:unnamed protein product [Ascophyllum nodosum]
MLGIKGDADVARMMRVFLRVDVKETHKLDIDTFFQYFDIESTEYNNRAFQLLAAFEDKEDIPRGNGSSNGRGRSLTFDQFFISMYNYGTLTHEALVRFAFDIMARGKDFCNKQDIMELASLLHSDPARIKETTHSLMTIMDPHDQNKITFATFSKEERRLQSMLFPAFKLQKILRAKVLGKRYWSRATEKRRKASLLGADLRQEFIWLKEEREVETTEFEPAPTHGPEESERHGSEASGGPMESQLSSTLSSDREFDKQAHQVSQQVYSKTQTGREGARRVSYVATAAEAIPPAAAPVTAVIQNSGSISDAMENKEKGEDSIMRRDKALKASVERRWSDDAHTLRDDGVQSARRLSSSMIGGGRRRTALLTKSSIHGVPGRRGSMFENMQVFEPSLPSVGGERRTLEKTSRVTPESH